MCGQDTDMTNDCCNNAHTHTACGLNLDVRKSGEGIPSAGSLHESAQLYVAPPPPGARNVPVYVWVRQRVGVCTK